MDENGIRVCLKQNIVGDTLLKIKTPTILYISKIRRDLFFLFMSVRSSSFFSFVGGYFVPFSFLSAWHF